MKRYRGQIQLLIFCIVVCFAVSLDGFSKDISFDEVPEAIQKIALREIGDVPINDVDREKEDGETVYDIEAKDDRVDIELEIAADETIRERDVTEKIAFSELPIPDHLAYQLGFPMDVVAVRGSGATPSRLNLFQRRDKMRGKRVVVWCLSVREFTEGQGWRKVPVIQYPAN